MTNFSHPHKRTNYEPALENLLSSNKRNIPSPTSRVLSPHLPSNADRERTLVPVAVVVDGQGSLHKLAGGVDLFVAVAVLDVGLGPAVVLGRVVFLAAGQFGCYGRGTLVMRV